MIGVPMTVTTEHDFVPMGKGWCVCRRCKLKGPRAEMMKDDLSECVAHLEPNGIPVHRERGSRAERMQRMIQSGVAPDLETAYDLTK